MSEAAAKKTHTPRQLLQECMESAVRLAFVRHDIQLDEVDDTQEEIANDAACACFGINTEVGNPIEEVTELLTKLDSFDEMVVQGKKLVEWLDKLADHSEKQAKSTHLITMREAFAADAKNFRASAKGMKEALAKAGDKQ